MTFTEFMIIYLLCLATMLVCRVAPIFILKGRQIPEKLERALKLIPPAAFAALVANDLLSPDMFAEGLTQGLIPLISAAIVVVVARVSGSLIWCALAGVGAFAALTFLLL